MTRHPISFLGGFLAGVCAMYYLDGASGGRRRALVRDRVVSTGHEAAWLAQAKAKRALDRARGVLATHSLDGRTRRLPESDQQLHDRIRARLGRTVSHPRSVHVDVDAGCVCLRGHVLGREVAGLVSEIQAMPGVAEVRNELQAHDSPQGIPELQGRTTPPGREQPERQADKAWH